jgi:hypothetical protein
MMGLALVLMVAARERLDDPTTHRALARALGEPAGLSVASPPAGRQAVPQSALAPDLLRSIEDNAPFRDAEQQAWFALLAAARDAELDVTQGVRVGYASLVSQPDVYRGTPVSVSGLVHRVERVVPAANEQEIKALWRVVLQGEGGEVWPITLYTLEEPVVRTFPHRAFAVGYFFKKLSYRYADGVGISPVIVARRLNVGELPTAPAGVALGPSNPADGEGDRAFQPPDAGSPGRALLADLGIDLKSIDALADQRPLLAAERDVFYRVLSAVREVPASQLARLARTGLDRWLAERERAAGDGERDRQTLAAVRERAAAGAFSVVPLFASGREVRGELMVFDTVVRRVVRVEVDPAVEQIDHYYELGAFTDDSQGLPLVFCVSDVPAGFPVGEEVRQPARLAGFFLKQWAYRSRIPQAETGSDAARFAPLLVGRAPIALVPPAPRGDGLAAGIVVAGAMGFALLVLWLVRTARADAAYSSATLARMRRLARGTPPNETTP